MPDRSQERLPAAAEPEREALGLLARRPLSESELRARLRARGHAADAVERSCRRLAAIGLLDDRKLALHFLVTRAERLGHGRERLVGDLVRRGVTRRVAESAWDEAVASGDLTPARLLEAQLRRRLRSQHGPLDRRAYARLASGLLRAGFPDGEVEQALERFRPHALEVDDDLP